MMSQPLISIGLEKYTNVFINNGLFYKKKIFIFYKE